jgi:flagellar biosynthesis protein FlhF
MRLRRFIGPDATTALRRVKDALGPEAVILATRASAGGEIEITAAVDADLATVVAQPARKTGPSELETIVRELRELGARVRSLDSALRPAAGTDARLGSEAQELADRLTLAGLARHLAAPVATSFEEARGAGMPLDAALEASLARHLLGATGAERRVTAFVGPTGSGKTTTIAKLAAARISAGRARIGLVMADTCRVGAAEQLGAYARLLGVPMQVARDAAELGRALAGFAACEAVYVDTAGLGGEPRGAMALGELLAAAGEALEVTAVVSAGASERALDHAWRQIDGLAPARCVVTKLDEGAGLGTACTWLAATGMVLAWVGTGQRVPEDLAVASGQTLARWLVAA